MTISNYSELLNTLGRWTKRGDLDNDAADLVMMGEARLNRSLKLLQMEETATVTISSGNDYAALPTGMLEPIDFYYTDTEEQITKVNKIDRQRYRYSSGKPSFYAVSKTLLFDCVANATYSPEMLFFKKWNIASDTTNWLLTNAPDAYVYASLAEAIPFIKDDKRIALWDAKAQKIIDDLNYLDTRARRANLRVDDAIVSPGGFDITRGY